MSPLLAAKVACTRMLFVHGSKQVALGTRIKKRKQPFCFFVVPASDDRSGLQQLLAGLFLSK
jgi:hypothetical protein